MNHQAVIDHISNWLKEYASSCNAKGFVLGVSGGIDSALTSILAAETGMNVLCVEMPIHQHESQVSRASKHIDWLMDVYPNVKRIEVSLTGVFDQLVAQFPEVEIRQNAMMPLVNTRARLRMTSLYYFAALEGLLVTGTGNKVEDFGVGFYTKYGDGGVDISPIADLMKTEVYGLCAHMGVIQSIQQAAPTDGLWGDDRTDEDQIGASYPELEWAMSVDAEVVDTSGFTDREKEVYAIYRKLNRANQHKMNPIPVCLIPDELKA